MVTLGERFHTLKEGAKLFRSFPIATQSAPRSRPQATNPADERPDSETGETEEPTTGMNLIAKWGISTASLCALGILGSYVGYQANEKWGKNARRQPESSLWYEPLGSREGDGDGTALEQLPAEPPPTYTADIRDDPACSGNRRPLESYDAGRFVMSATSGEGGASS
jgi:hypothetical protein